MTAVQLPKTGLIKQDFKDARWDGPLNQGFDAWEARIGVAGTTSPVGVARGYYIGQTFYDTATGVLYYCSAVGNPGTWVQAALQSSILNYGNYIPLASSGTVIPAHHRTVLSYAVPGAGSWTMQAGGFTAGWNAKITTWSGGALTIIAAPNQPLITAGQRLTSLTLNFPDEGELYSPDGTNFVWFGLRHFTSPVAALNAGSTYDYSHSLGLSPQKVFCRLHCTVPELGYVPGDVVHIGSDTQAANYGILAKGSATNISAKTAVAGIQLLDWVQGITAPITMSSWSVSLRGEVVN
jgi:hypothetical protein